MSRYPTDVSFKLLITTNYKLRIRKKRPSLRLIISSATLQTDRLLDYFDNPDGEATVLSLEGRIFPVEIAYLQEPTNDYVRKDAEVAANLNVQVSVFDPPQKRS